MNGAESALAPLVVRSNRQPLLHRDKCFSRKFSLGFFVGVAAFLQRFVAFLISLPFRVCRRSRGSQALNPASASTDSARVCEHGRVRSLIDLVRLQTLSGRLIRHLPRPAIHENTWEKRGETCVKFT